MTHEKFIPTYIIYLWQVIVKRQDTVIIFGLRHNSTHTHTHRTLPAEILAIIMAKLYFCSLIQLRTKVCMCVCGGGGWNMQNQRRGSLTECFINSQPASVDNNHNGAQEDSPRLALFLGSSERFLMAVAAALTTESWPLLSRSASSLRPLDVRTMFRLYTAHCNTVEIVRWRSM